MSEIKLKNCPFCGGEAEMGFRDASAFVYKMPCKKQNGCGVC